ncbi:MAG: carbohydrate ABC transporter permease [Granulosicoccus sp.]
MISRHRLPSRLSCLGFSWCLFWLFITLFPLYWVFVTSFKPPTAVSLGPTYFPGVDFQPTMNAYSDALFGKRGQLFSPLWHSMLISLTSAFLAVLIGSMAAYSLVRFEFRVKLLSGLFFVAFVVGAYLIGANQYGLNKAFATAIAFGIGLPLSIWINSWKIPGPILGNNDVLFWFVSQRMFPPIVSAFSLFLIYSETGKAGIPLLDTFVGMVLAYTAFTLPIAVWLMRDFIASVPLEIEEAALIEDVPRLRIFFDIVLPMTLPGLIATFVIVLSFIWNEFLYSLLLTTSKWQTLPVWLAGQNSYRGDEWWAIAVAAVISIAPMVVVAATLARFMRSGLAIGGIK